MYAARAKPIGNSPEEKRPNFAPCRSRALSGGHSCNGGNEHGASGIRGRSAVAGGGDTHAGQLRRSVQDPGCPRGLGLAPDLRPAHRERRTRTHCSAAGDRRPAPTNRLGARAGDEPAAATGRRGSFCVGHAHPGAHPGPAARYPGGAQIGAAADHARSGNGRRDRRPRHRSASRQDCRAGACFGGLERASALIHPRTACRPGTLAHWDYIIVGGVRNP